MGMTANKVVVIIPALNEEKSIGMVIDSVPKEILSSWGYDTKVVVVDGHSTDRTFAIAEEKGATVIVQKGKGKGLGMRQAFSLCNPQRVVPTALTLQTGDCSKVEGLSALLDVKLLIMLDADGTYPPHHILDMVSALEGGADVVMGSRFKGEIEEGAMTPLNHFGNIMLSDIASLLYQKHCTDLCTGMWGFNIDALKQMDLNSRHFELEAEMFAESAKKGLNVEEVPITYRVREGDTKLVPIKAGFAILSKLLERRFWSAEGELDIRLHERPEKSPIATPSRLM
jgi:glycosyltransferase involved in cell wall biosynthesis